MPTIVRAISAAGQVHGPVDSSRFDENDFLSGVHPLSDEDGEYISCETCTSDSEPEEIKTKQEVIVATARKVKLEKIAAKKLEKKAVKLDCVECVVSIFLTERVLWFRQKTR